MEEWKDVIGYEGLYQVSNLGQVRSLDRFVKGRYNNYYLKKGQILKIQHNSRVDVYEVHLYKNNYRKCYTLHRLVAEAFLYNDDPINKTTVNHKDGNRANNTVENLEWCSYSENEKHSYDVLKRCINATEVKKRQCIAILKDTKEKNTYESIAETSRKTGISETQIRRIAKKESINKKYDFIIK